jgi:hypothetical protein
MIIKIENISKTELSNNIILLKLWNIDDINSCINKKLELYNKKLKFSKEPVLFKNDQLFNI